jgi:hypothetical protein
VAAKTTARTAPTTTAIDVARAPAIQARLWRGEAAALWLLIGILSSTLMINEVGSQALKIN